MDKHKNLPRLEAAHYRAQSYVHWTLTVQDRRTGWLDPTFHCWFRELLAHVAFRYALTCPIYCLMPDHLHLLWIGIADRSNQLQAMKCFRKHLSSLLERLGFEFQHQPHDHVLRDDERLESAFLQIVEHIARNPERKQLVPIDGFRDYPFTGCLVPGYPELSLWQKDYWLRFWRTYAYLRKHDLFRFSDDDH